MRLPTEYEWQLAATGGDVRSGPIPGGRTGTRRQEPWRANTVESELGRSTAVGMYPAGASPAGILDMAGTLWEWCSNAFDDPDNTAFPATQEDRRVLRGGSWGNDQDVARSAIRFRGYPSDRTQPRRFPCGVFVPINWALIPESAAQAARQTARSAVSIF